MSAEVFAGALQTVIQLNLWSPAEQSLGLGGIT